VADSPPVGCGSVPALIATTAKLEYEASPSVRTHIIGWDFGPNNRQSLNDISRSGGTGDAQFPLVAADQLKIALINAAALTSCALNLPVQEDGGLLDPGYISLLFKVGFRDPLELPRLESAQRCADHADQGWYFDDPAAPETIHLCAKACQDLPTGTLQVRVGCRPMLGD
jgi:hypothetical protein